jgi:hypothetical protein
MLAQLFKEREVGFPTPEDENVSPLAIIETTEEHLGYLANELGLDPLCPAPSREHLAECYPLGIGRMSDEEHDQTAVLEQRKNQRDARDEVIAALTTHGDEWKIFWIDFPDHVETELTGLEEQYEIEPVGGDLEQAIVAKAFRKYCESDTRAMDFTETVGEVISEMTVCKEPQ